MPNAIDPHHSRPLDVHRWSDHPEARELTEQIWSNPIFNDLREEGKPKGGVKPKRRFKEQLRVLVLDLFVAWKTDPDLALGVSMSMGNWNTKSRYNALHLSKVIPDLVHRLHALELIELSMGSYTAPGAKGNRTTRIRATERMMERFERAAFGLEDLEPVEGRETVILRGEGKKPLEYEDTEDTIRWRRDLETYNRLLQDTFIDIPSLEQPFIERAVEQGPRVGHFQRIPINPINMHVHRVFSRGRWDLNGRFYGGWWQQIGQDLRQQIHINDEPTVEVDYRGLHVALLSHEQGVRLVGDPYALAEDMIEGIDAAQQRRYLKHLVLTAVNARSRKTAFQAFRNNFGAKERGKTLTNDDLERLLDAFLEKHPHLRESMCADQGIRLMFIDSQIADSVLGYFLARELPVLMVHDSFIVQRRYEDDLIRTLQGAAHHRTRADLEVSVIPGQHFVDPLYDEVAPGDLQRTEGYLGRMARHRDRPGELY